MFKFPFVLRSKYDKLLEKKEWWKEQAKHVNNEADRFHNELEDTKESHSFANVMFQHYKKHYEVLHDKITHPRAANGRFIQISEVK